MAESLHANQKQNFKSHCSHRTKNNLQKASPHVYNNLILPDFTLLHHHLGQNIWKMPQSNHTKKNHPNHCSFQPFPSHNTSIWTLQTSNIWKAPQLPFINLTKITLYQATWSTLSTSHNRLFLSPNAIVNTSDSHSEILPSPYMLWNTMSLKC